MAKKTGRPPKFTTVRGEDGPPQRFWGGIPLVDATQDLRIYVAEEDLAQAVRKDENACVFAEACKRMFATTRIYFTKEIAFLLLVDEEGNKVYERYILSGAMKRLIADFDRGKEVVVDRTFILNAPSPCRTLNSELRRNRDSKRRRRLVEEQEFIEGQEAREGPAGVGEAGGDKGEEEPKEPRKQPRKRNGNTRVIDLTVRHSAGRVNTRGPDPQFPGTAK